MEKKSGIGPPSGTGTGGRTSSHAHILRHGRVRFGPVRAGADPRHAVALPRPRHRDDGGLRTSAAVHLLRCVGPAGVRCRGGHPASRGGSPRGERVDQGALLPGSERAQRRHADARRRSRGDDRGNGQGVPRRSGGGRIPGAGSLQGIPAGQRVGPRREPRALLRAAGEDSSDADGSLPAGPGRFPVLRGGPPVAEGTRSARGSLDPPGEGLPVREGVPGSGPARTGNAPARGRPPPCSRHGGVPRRSWRKCAKRGSTERPPG